METIIIDRHLYILRYESNDSQATTENETDCKSEDNGSIFNELTDNMVPLRRTEMFKVRFALPIRNVDVTSQTSNVTSKTEYICIYR